MQPGYALELGDDGEQIARAWISVRTEHPHEALGRRAGRTCELREANRSVDIVAQDGLAGLQISGQEQLDSLLEQRLAESRIAGGSLLYGFFEFPRQRHVSVPLSCVACSPPIGRAPFRCPAAGGVWCRH